LFDGVLVSEDRPAFFPAQAVQVDRFYHVTT
jgi:hypothetical protein